MHPKRKPPATREHVPAHLPRTYRAPTAQIARRDLYTTTEDYIYQHREEIGPATARALEAVGARAGEGIFTMWGTLTEGVGPLLREIGRTLDRSFGYINARELASPTSLEYLVDRGRETTRTSEDLLTVGTDDFHDDVGTAIADAIALNLRHSLERILPRYAAAKSAAQRAQWNERGECDLENAPEPHPNDLVKSHPVDKFVRDAACLNGLFRVDLEAWRSHHPELADDEQVSGVRDVDVHLAGNSDVEPTTFNTGRFYLWIRANPGDATVEEVAQAFFGRTSFAHLITINAAPLFGFNAAHVWNLPTSLRNSIIGQSPALQAEEEARERRDTGEQAFIGFMVPRYFAEDPEGASTSIPDPTAGLPPALADEIALGSVANSPAVPDGEVRDRTAILSQMGTNVALLQSIDELGHRFEELSMWDMGFPRESAVVSLITRLIGGVMG